MAVNPTEWATQLVSEAGYAGLVSALVVNSAGIPVPSEVILPLVGALVKQGRFNAAVVLVVAVVAQTAGAQVAYELGRRWGTPLVVRYGRYVLLNERELTAATNWFQRFGGWACGLGRVVPFIRSYVGYPAGVAQYSRTKFAAVNLLGTTIWTAGLMAIGYTLADHLSSIDNFFHRFTLGVIGLLVVLVLIWYASRRHARG